MAATDSSVNVRELAVALKEAIQETAPVVQEHISRYRGATPFNPSGAQEHERPQLRGTFLQNGSKMSMPFLSDNEINLLNQLKPGRFIGRKVEVVERVENGEVTVEIRYSNGTNEQRLEMKNEVRNLAELLERCIAEAGKPAKK